MADKIEDIATLAYRNPLMLQRYCLDRLENKTGITITDPNNVVTQMINMFCDLTAGAVETVHTVTEGLYPVRAKTSEDLYKHMSDYDYVNLYSSPASCQVGITLDKDFILASALPVAGENYHKLVIPKNSIANINGYNFGFYYPIEIRVNKTAGTVTVVQDVSVINPFHILTKNILEHRFFTNGSSQLMTISAPMYQFERSYFSDDITVGTGFNKRYGYSDRFYAIRVFSNVRNTTDPTLYDWKELKISLSKSVYDTEEVTCLIKVHPELQQVQVEIPQVYLTEEMVRGVVKIEIWTTSGAIEFDIPDAVEGKIGFSMISNENTTDEIKYSEPLQYASIFSITPINTKVIGGTNGYGFEELRKRIINDTFSVSAPITDMQVTSYFDSKGFEVTRYQDGIKDRIFLCHNKITDGVTGSTIAAASLNTYFDTKMAMPKDVTAMNQAERNLRVPGIIRHDSERFTILPSTIYEFDITKNACVPLTYGELNRITNLSTAERVNEYNHRVFTISLFHLAVHASDRYQTAVAYDLRKPELKVNEFIGENSGTLKQLSLYGFSITPSKNGPNGFTMLFSVSRTEDLKNFTAVTNTGVKLFRVLVAVMDVYDRMLYGEATYIGRYEDRDLFQLNLETDFQMDQFITDQKTNEDAHAILMKNTLKDTDGGLNHFVYLNSKFRIVLTINRNVFDPLELEGLGKVIETTLPSEFINEYAVGEHQMDISIGSPIGALSSRISLSYNARTMKRYETTKFAVIDTPVYARNPETGAFEYTVIKDDNQVITGVELTTLYPAGTLSMVANGNGSYPSFMVMDAHSDTNGVDSPVNGQYIATSTTTIGALSKYNDTWTKAVTGQGTGNSETWNYTFKVVDALGLVLGSYTSAPMCMQVATVAELPTTGVSDQFVWVVNAAKSDGTGGTVYDTPVYGLLKGESVQASTCIGRLYLWTDEYGWRAMVGGVDLASVKTIVSTTNTAGSYYGYAYVLMLDKPLDLNNLLYVSFLSKEVPALSGEGLTGLEEEKVSFRLKNNSTDWSIYINQWVWDVKSWYYVKNTSSVINSSTKNWKQIIKDETIQINLVKAGIESFIDYATGQVILDGNGNPIYLEDGPQGAVYLVNMLHLDAKLSAGNTATYKSYPEPVCELLRTYFTTVKTIRPELLESTKLYFEPIRSIGNGKFKTASGKSVDMSLDITVALRVYVSKSSAENSQLLDLLKARIETIIDAMIEEGTLNCTILVKRILEEVPDVVKYVDVLGINNDPELQTLICSDNSVRPHLKHELVLLEDGTIDVTRGLRLDVVASED